MRRLRKLLAYVRREQHLIRELRPSVGIRRATAARVRANLELDGVPERLAALEQATAAKSGRAPSPGPAPSGIPLSELRPRARPDDGALRVLGVNEMFPLISETYIHDELVSLVPHGAEIAWYRRSRGPATPPVSQPLFEDFDEAIARFDPSVAVVHWLTAATVVLPLFERHGLPFGIRCHSFDFDRDTLAGLLTHPLCLGAWTFSAPEYRAEGAHTLDPVFSSVDQLPEPPPVRDKVISMSAGLPKKDWPLLLDAFDRIEGVDCRLVVGVTTEHEDNPSDLVRACQERANPPLLQVNLVRQEALRLLTEAALFVYTLKPDVRFGMPMSVAEALCAGCSVVVPDRPEALEYAGPHARPYRTAADIAAHAREVLAGGEAIAAEQDANRAYGRARFCDPEAGERFHEQLVAGLDACYARASSQSVKL